MNEQPLISVIVPVYNVEQSLDRCVRSIVAQTYRHLEIILVDDGSPDDCPRLCDAWAGQDDRIRVIHKLNGGLSDARNAGLDAMRGDFIAFVDSDDYVEPDYVNRLYAGISDAEMSVCAIICEDPRGKTRQGSEPITDERIAVSSEEYLRRALLDWRLVVAWNKLYAASIWNQLRFPVGRIHEDEYVLHQVVDQCMSINVLPDELYHYVSTDSSITHSGFSIRNLDRLEALARRLEYCISKNYRQCAALTFDKFIEDLDFASGLDWSDRAIHAKLGEIFAQLRHVPLSAGAFLSSKRRMQFLGLWFAPFLTEWMLKKAKHL
ncbi:glycosyltransferase [Bifidobacterium adolescentis]|uniref:glycosyltransferase family 2 protein n=1 Tax=Bifidobacterium TaxID=1678 RepID=UPI00283FDAC1|nr:glycosyltransferase [Bifidobacterium sp.]MDR4021619.1 glycosyltransferase [Bifidobacterium sp.]